MSKFCIASSPKSKRVVTLPAGSKELQLLRERGWKIIPAAGPADAEQKANAENEAKGKAEKPQTAREKAKADAEKKANESDAETTDGEGDDKKEKAPVIDNR